MYDRAEVPVGGGRPSLWMPTCQDRTVSEKEVVRVGSERHSRLVEDGWTVAARSFGAELRAEDTDVGVLTSRAARADVREILPTDVPAVLALDAETLHDYPGGAATQHGPLDARSAEPSRIRRAFGVWNETGVLVAMTYVHVDAQQSSADTDFTVVAPLARERGLGTAVKAASVLALLADGVRTFRTGGSAENPRIIAANTALGYVIDEEWVTLAAP
jgi:hypothetical protein